MTRTPTEALAESRHTLRNITASVVADVAGTRIPGVYADADVLATELSRVLTEVTGRPWPADDITALAAGIRDAAKTERS